MKDLAFDLKSLTLHNGEGSYMTKMQRHRGLQLIARELDALGYKLPRAHSLKTKHVDALVKHWQGAGLTAGTLKNRMSWVRWWAGKVRKVGVVPRANAALDIGPKQVWKGDKAHVTTGDRLARLPDWMQAAVKLQMAFGLRLEESLKFRPDVADQGDSLALKASWCKGGRGRSVPVTHPRQRALLDAVAKLTGGGAVIPLGVSYIQARKAIESASLAAGIRNLHGHRHWYAQWRYQTMIGAPSPAAGGKHYENMTKGERAADYRVRLAISRELGHNRIQVTDAYLGGRFAKTKAA